MFLPAQNPQKAYGLTFLKLLKTKSPLLPITAWKCLPSRRNGLLARMSLHEGRYSIPAIMINSRTCSPPTAYAQPQARAAYKELGGEGLGKERGRRRWSEDAKQGRVPASGAPGMSPYPSHSWSSLDSILDSTGRLPKMTC